MKERIAMGNRTYAIKLRTTTVAEHTVTIENKEGLEIDALIERAKRMPAPIGEMRLVDLKVACIAFERVREGDEG
jgi:hypothetical protein